MFGILARTFHTAARVDPYETPPRPETPARTWPAPRHWLRSDSQPAETDRV